MGTFKDLELLINSRYPLIALASYEEERAEEINALREWAEGRAGMAN